MLALLRLFRNVDDSRFFPYEWIRVLDLECNDSKAFFFL
jgi:hypothetical protein